MKPRAGGSGFATARAGGIAAVVLAALVGGWTAPAPAALYDVTNAGIVFESLNDGISWTERGAIAEPEVVALCPGLSPGVLFALGAAGGVYRSTTSGTSWAAVGNVEASDCVAAAVARNGDVLALTRSGDLWRSADGGAAWVRESNAGASDYVALAVAGRTGAADTLLAATSSGDVARAPGSASWTTVGSTGLAPLVDLLWLRGEVYALSDAGEMLRSTNAGAGWTAIGTVSQVGMRALAYTGGKFKAVSREGEVYESVTGSAWSPSWIGATNQVFTVAFAPGVPEFLTGVGGPAPAAFAFDARPSVFSDRVAFHLAGVPSGVVAEIGVFDAAGRRVAAPSPSASGAPATWDGRAPDGSRAASGVYFARVVAGPLTETVRIVLLR